MKCPQCQTDMIKSKLGWLCPNCGFAELSSAPASAPAPATSSVPTTSQHSKPPTPNPKSKPTPPASGSNPTPSTAPKSPTTVETPTTDHVAPEPVVTPPSAAKPAVLSPDSDSAQPHQSPPAAGQAQTIVSAAATRPTPRPNIKRLLIALTTLIVLIIAGAGYVVAARSSYQGFQQRLSSAKTITFNGQLKFAAEGFLSSFGSDLNFSGRYDNSTVSSPKGELKFNGAWASQQYDGQTVLSDGALFFKLGGPVLPVIRYNQSSFLYPLTADWYKTKIDNSLYGNYCETRPDTKYPQAIELYRLLRSLKANNSPWVNLFGQLNGKMAAHYRGSIPSNQIPDLLNHLNSQLPETCGVQYQPPSDTKKLAINYDLWTTPHADRIKLTLADQSIGANLSFIVDLGGYNQPVTISPPPAAIDLNLARQSQLDLLDRDHTRRNDIDKLKAALDNFAAANKQLYPTNLSLLTPKYLTPIPSDPKTKQAYPYTVGSGRKSFTLSANLEEPNAGAYTATRP